MLLLAVAVLATAGVVVAVLVAVLGGGSTPAVSQTARGPVILVPGYGGSLSALQPIRVRLAGAGRTVQELSLPDGGVGDLTAQAGDLGRLVARDLAAGAPSVDLVGYSAGGVTVRIYENLDGGAAHTRRVVTIGSPQHGTQLASSAGLLLGSGCTGGCAELQVGSSLLDRLNAGREIPAAVPWLTTWSDDDQTVVPPDSERLAGADNIDLQSVCPRDQTSHSLEPRDPLVIGLVLQALQDPSLPHPTASDCGSLRVLGSR